MAARSTDDAAFVFAYLDDTLLGVPAPVAEEALNLVERIFTEEGYSLNRAKSLTVTVLLSSSKTSKNLV